MKVEQEKTVLQAQKDQLAQNLEAVMKDKLQPHKQVQKIICFVAPQAMLTWPPSSVPPYQQ